MGSLWYTDLLQASGQKLQWSSEFSSRFEIREVWLSNSVFFFSDFFTLFDRKLRWIGLSAKMAFFIKAKWFYEAYCIYSNKRCTPDALTADIEILHGSHIEWQDNENYLH